MDGWRQAAVLAVIALAVLAALALTGAATADDGEQVAAAPPALQPTQVAAEIPEGYNQLFPLQWGGGSLFQLKSRLATMGCIANTIWNYDGGEWHGYNQYNVPSTLNAGWLAAYEEFVPAGSLYVTCFDVCEFGYFEAPRPGECVSVAGFRERNFYNVLPFPIDESSECTDDFDERVKKHVLSSMPLYPDVCIIRQPSPTVRANVTTPIASTSRGGVYPYYPAIIVLYYPATVPPPVTERTKVRLLATEIHELCHTNQYFHSIEQLQPDSIEQLQLDRSVTVPHDDSSDYWAVTTAGNTFIDLVGFARSDDGGWSLPDGVYKGIYGTNKPVELAAELCMLYFVNRMGERNDYGEDFDPGRYLTDEIVDWIETWVVLPEITAAETD